MSFYLKLLLIMSLVGQSIAVACIDTIVGHHDARRKLFNTSSYEGTLEDAAPDINRHSDGIRDILMDEQKVNVKRHASTDEKEKILKAVIAERLIAKKMGMTLGIAKKPDTNPYKNICTDPALVGHFKVLELTWQLGDECGNEILAKLNSQDCKETDQSNYTDLFRLIGIDGSLCMEWLQELVAEHIIGVRPENIVLPPKNDMKEEIDLFNKKSGYYFLRSLAEVSSHPLAIIGVVSFAEIKEEPHNAPIKMDFFYSALKGIASHLGISPEERPLTAGKACDLGMEIFGEIAANNDHSLSDIAGKMLSSHEALSAMKLRLIKLFGNEQEEKPRKFDEERFTAIAATTEHKDRYSAAIHILKEGNFTEESATVAIDALKDIARTDNHPCRYQAAKWLTESENAEDQKIGIDALRNIAQNNDHSFQYLAACFLINSLDPNDQEIAMEAFRNITQSNHPGYQNKAKEKLAKLERIHAQAGSAKTPIKSVIRENGRSFAGVQGILDQTSQIEPGTTLQKAAA